LRSQQRTDVAMQRKIGLLGALDGLGHVRVGGMHQLSHLAANLLLPARERSNVVVDAGVGLVCTHGSMIPRIKVLLLGCQRRMEPTTSTLESVASDSPMGNAYVFSLIKTAGG